MILTRIWKQTILTTRHLKSVRRAFQSLSAGMELNEVVKCLENYTPLSLAESWDNVGLLVAPSTASHMVSSILLTNDLTEAVMEEAIASKANMILSYHPPIFAPLKTLTRNSWKERVVLMAIENKIAIYSPHTALDSVKGGVNDWLASGVGPGTVKPLKHILVDQEKGTQDVKVEDMAGTGVGRLCTLAEPVPVGTIIDRIKDHLKLPNIRFAKAQEPENNLVKTVAICAGSGGSVLKGIKADAYLTGEMSHHEVLDAVSNGVHVILGEHSNTERGFLRNQLRFALFVVLEKKITVKYSNIDEDPINIV